MAGKFSAEELTAPVESPVATELDKAEVPARVALSEIAGATRGSGPGSNFGATGGSMTEFVLVITLDWATGRLWLAERRLCCVFPRLAYFFLPPELLLLAETVLLESESLLWVGELVPMSGLSVLLALASPFTTLSSESSLCISGPVFPEPNVWASSCVIRSSRGRSLCWTPKMTTSSFPTR